MHSKGLGNFKITRFLKLPLIILIFIKTCDDIIVSGRIEFLPHN